MAFLNIKYWFRKDSAKQSQFDDGVWAEHNEAVARGDKRILGTGADGNLHSYQPEEYGAERGGRYPLTSVPGHLAWTGVWAFALAAVIWATIAGFMSAGASLRELKLMEDNGWIGILLLFILVCALGLFFVLGLKDLIKEIRASRVRRRRGIPRPID